MATPYPTTAEQVVSAVEAASVAGRPVDADLVSAFADIPKARAESALAMGKDLGLLQLSGTSYVPASPLSRFLVRTRPDQTMAALRIVLETHDAFLMFRARLLDGHDGSASARHTKAVLGLDGHRDDIAATLVDLGTYTHALESSGGGQYKSRTETAVNSLQTLAEASEDMAGARARITAQLGEDAFGKSPPADTVEPLADALQRAGQGDSAGAVQQAGNAVEAYLVALAARLSISVQGANGLNAKVERIGDGSSLPSKLRMSSKYLGHVRNAADHGPDPEVGNQSWRIRENTGTEYVFVACSFLASLAAWEAGQSPTL